MMNLIMENVGVSVSALLVYAKRPIILWCSVVQCGAARCSVV